MLSVKVNGTSIDVPPGATVAAAIAIAGDACRLSVTGQRRGPLCGMGICYECRVTVNGVAHTKSCQTACEPGMDIRSDE
ncbi:MAG TPA: 2Fe-2S iron-sulfur cluster-binding protein [Verrucomicrobiae bacterium]|jgi:D-hydroxyproline dehydrogenase subunit gamma|nr:2Fe-2S iron-sulfur cluster-binding protein [Verrucomicrobiae bacterium]